MDVACTVYEARMDGKREQGRANREWWGGGVVGWWGMVDVLVGGE